MRNLHLIALLTYACDRAIVASILRLIFMLFAFPTGQLGFGYQPSTTQRTPLVLHVFDSTFFIMVEMWLGVWVANLPPCAPLLRCTQVSESPGDSYYDIKVSDMPPSLKEFQWNATGHLCILCRHPHDETYY